MAPTRKSRQPSPRDWEDLAEEAILGMRVRDLGLSIASPPLQPFIEKLYAELDDRGILFHPPCYLADEWFCPDKVPIIGIPFCLAHPRLRHIERKMMFEVEGDTDKTLMQLLRHECGHAINYAHYLYRRTRWRELFGSFSTRYCNSYESRPYSRRYVVHLADNYAQAHPDEDFAEAFAVWLCPQSRWRERYADWPVIKKLQYVDRLMADIGGRAPLNTSADTPYAAARMTSTLAAHYERKRQHLGDEFPGYYDAALQRLFASAPGDRDVPPAATFLRLHRRQIIDGVAAWTGQRKYDVHELIGKLVKRCNALELYAAKDGGPMLVDVTAFVTAVTTKVLWNQGVQKRR